MKERAPRTFFLATALTLAVVSGVSACCGDGEPAGPRPAAPLAERDPAGGPVEVLSFDRPLAGAERETVERALQIVPGAGTARIADDGRAVRVWFREAPVPVAALVEALNRLAASEARPTTLTRIFLPRGGEKGNPARATMALLKSEGIVDLEIELEGHDGLARVWHHEALRPEALRDALTRDGIQAILVMLPEARPELGSQAQ